MRYLAVLVVMVVGLAAGPARGDDIDVGDLPPRRTKRFAEVLEPSPWGGDTMRAWGSRCARLVLERCDRNKRKAWEVLGISYHTLQSYLRHTPAMRTNWDVANVPTPSRTSVEPTFDSA